MKKTNNFLILNLKYKKFTNLNITFCYAIYIICFTFKLIKLRFINLHNYAIKFCYNLNNSRSQTELNTTS